MADHKINNYAPELTKEEQHYEDAVRHYGSYGNYKQKLELLREEYQLLEDYTTIGAATEEEAFEKLRAVPIFFDAFSLRELPLHLLGAPLGSKEGSGISEKTDLRVKRLPPEAGEKPLKTTWHDYSSLGWPSSAGYTRRWVTPEEHAEITRRLNSSSLTLPGSEVMLRVQTLAEMLREDTPTPPWLVDGLLRKGGAAMVYGPAGVGKTWLVHTLMLLAAVGEELEVKGPGGPILKAGDHKGAKVVIIDGEMTKADITQRDKVLVKSLGVSEEITAGISVVLKTYQDYRSGFPDLVDEAWVTHLIRICRDDKVDLLVLDNLSTLTSAEDENAMNVWHEFNRLVVGLKEAGVACLVVHHSGKGEKASYRGSSNLITTMETVIKLERLSGPHEKHGAAFTVSLDKDRARGRPPIKDASLVLKDDRWEVVIDENQKLVELCKLVRSYEYSSQAELAVAMGVNQRTIGRWKEAAERTPGMLKADKRENEWKQCLAEAKQRRRDRAMELAGVGFEGINEGDGPGDESGGAVLLDI